MRAARADDAAEVARLAGELGYPTSAEEVMERLVVLIADERYVVVVAETARSLAGWVSGERRLSLETGTFWEITGLVVDSLSRRQGVGKELVLAVESWARSQGAESVRVRSNVAREESHNFYQRIGYSRRKTQHAYMKKLGE